MAVEVIDVSEGLPTGLTGVILPHLVSVGIGIGNGIWILSSKNRYNCYICFGQLSIYFNVSQSAVRGNGHG